MVLAMVLIEDVVMVMILIEDALTLLTMIEECWYRNPSNQNIRALASETRNLPSNTAVERGQAIIITKWAMALGRQQELDHAGRLKQYNK